jgi:hypothetical protein
LTALMSQKLLQRFKQNTKTRMKKIFLAAILLFSVTMNARVWNVTTTCGVIGQINVADNATVQQLTDAVATYNLMHCGVYPKVVRIISST